MAWDNKIGYKRVFAHREMVEDPLRAFVREPWVAEVEIDTLERVSGSFGHRASGCTGSRKIGLLPLEQPKNLSAPGIIHRHIEHGTVQSAEDLSCLLDSFWWQGRTTLR